MTEHETPLHSLTRTLAGRAHQYEESGAWPQASLDDYAALGGFGWGVPQSHGGTAMPTVDRLHGYIALARGDMSTALFVTQHEGAVDLVVTCANEPLRTEWLPRFATGRALTTIGYSQLTTSRQGGLPAMRAEPVAGGFLLEGVMPWVTGAPYVDTVACGAALDDRTQILTLLPLNAPGVEVQAAAPLAALNSSATCEVTCNRVFTPVTDLVAGPVERVLSERSALRLLLVSATGTGLALGIGDEIAMRDPHLGGRLHDQTQALEAKVFALAADPALDQAAIDVVRVEVNLWLMRLAGMLMLVAKGTGYRRDAMAQRLAKEALFFCVWSASGNVRDATQAALLDAPFPATIP